MQHILSSFFDKELTPKDIGKIFSVDKTNNPNFDEIVTILSNGSDNVIEAGVSTAVAFGQVNSFESIAFNKKNAPFPDFQGQTITSFDLFVNEINSSGLNLTLNVNGFSNSTSVPEPSFGLGSLIFSLFGVGLTLKHRLRQNYLSKAR
ncbi:MAG: hypothetical protein KME32_29850 [Mojavia pulchra JT2-VF2]|jgi:hypothetical protein|uniref:Uncharacterized protein n=1 Tax=Mojavia pulchra JT2-VF2 TaxID=287848 RepID=A0A951UKB0_9NOST|nr:hypothetical protein [Mojavia pulchra JT2-VF2]